MKKVSQECFHNWKGAGCPRSGPIFDCKKNCHYRYKTALRKSKVAEGRQKSDKLYANLLDKNGISFWNNWKSINKVGPTVSTRIDGETEDDRIAAAFAGYFSTVYGGNDTDQHIAQKFHRRFSDYFADHINDSLSPYYLSWTKKLNWENQYLGTLNLNISFMVVPNCLSTFICSLMVCYNMVLFPPIF